MKPIRKKYILEKTSECFSHSSVGIREVRRKDKRQGKFASGFGCVLSCLCCLVCSPEHSVTFRRKGRPPVYREVRECST